MVIPGFGPKMKDVDGRAVEVAALCHKKWGDSNLTPRAKGEPEYWNFLEMEFDPRPRDATIEMRIRNLIDATSETPRGGEISTVASATGRKPIAKLPPIKTLPLADVEGHPILASRSDENGIIKINGVPDIPAGTRLLMTAFDGKQTESKVLTMIGS